MAVKHKRDKIKKVANFAELGRNNRLKVTGAKCVKSPVSAPSEILLIRWQEVSLEGMISATKMGHVLGKAWYSVSKMKETRDNSGQYEWLYMTDNRRGGPW